MSNLSLSDKYWAVTLDGKPLKTMYKDNMLVPSRALAVVLAEEWEAQKEVLDLKSLHLVSLIKLMKCRIISWLSVLELLMIKKLSTI